MTELITLGEAMAVFQTPHNWKNPVWRHEDGSIAEWQKEIKTENND